MQHPEGTKCTTMTSGGRRKMHYTFPDESEMVDEFDVQTDVLLVRKKRRKTMLGGLGEWVYEARGRHAAQRRSPVAPPRCGTLGAARRWARRRRV